MVSPRSQSATSDSVYFFEPTNPLHLPPCRIWNVDVQCYVHACAYLTVLHTPLPCPVTVYGEITNFNLSVVPISMHINARHSKELFCLILIVRLGKEWYARSDTVTIVTRLVAPIIIPVLVTIPLNVVLVVL